MNSNRMLLSVALSLSHMHACLHIQTCKYTRAHAHTHTHMHTAPVITIVLILLFYFPPHCCLLFGSRHANVVGNEQKKKHWEGGWCVLVWWSGVGWWGGQRDTISMPQNNQKSSTPPFFVLYFSLWASVCVLVGGKGGVSGWVVVVVVGAVAVMCLTDIEDNCALSSSCLCNSTAAAAWATLTWAREEGRADVSGSCRACGGVGREVGALGKRKRSTL